MATINDAPPVLRLTQHLSISILWFALYAQWLTVVPVIVPDQIGLMVGGTFKEGISGTVVGAGALMSLVITPIAGAWSDRIASRTGRRRPFLIIGMLGSCLALWLLTLFGAEASVLLYGLAFVHLQFWWNLAAGPYAGLVADVVPKPEQGRASAWLMVMSILGTVVGNGLLAAFYKSDDPAPVIFIFIGLNIACLWMTVQGVREPSSTGSKEQAPPFFANLFPPIAGNGNFYWVLVTRLFANMGVWSIFTFLIFYVRDVIHIDRPETVLPALLGAGAVLAVPAAIWGTRLAERHGPVRIVWATSWVMAAASLCYVLVAFRPSLVLVVPVVVVFSAAYGAYQAVDWALALAVLPSGEDAGKDMGIWHISMVLPQALGPISSGWLITLVIGGHSAAMAYTIAFAIAAAWFVLASVFVRRVRL